MIVEPYLSFDGRCDEAIAFYKSALGAEVQFLMRFKDIPGGGDPAKISAQMVDKVMHASLRIGESRVMVTDGHCKGAAKFSGISLSLAVASDEDAQRKFNSLAEGGTITTPIGKTFFSSSFGMVTDRFGVSWMVIVEA